MGNVGAGIGATVGKLCGMKQSMKAGLGVHAIQVGELKIAAVVAVNALGDIFNPDNGQKVAGLLDPERKCFLDSEQTLLNVMTTPKDLFHTNTTIGCVICNAKFDKAKLNKIASMTRNAYARCINPVGTLSARVMEKVILKAIEASKIEDEEYLKYCL